MTALGIGSARGAYLCGTSPFLLPSSFPAGNTPNSIGSIAKGDFNGDNHTDLVVLDEEGFSLLLGNGDGTFQSPTLIGSDQSFSSIVVGDLDGNGHLAVVASQYQNIFVYKSNGDGTFQDPVTFSRDSDGPIALGRFDGDSNIDIVAANEVYEGSISVFLGNGDGTFQAPVTTTGLPFVPGLLTTGDFDGDDKLDIAVAAGGCCGENVVYVMRGNGAGGFGDPVSYAAGGSPEALLAVDVDMDNHTDLAVAVGGFVSILLNAGDGTFDAPLEYSAPGSNGPLVWDDFDGNGTPDLAILGLPDFNSSNVNVLLGNGDGSFQPSRQYLFTESPRALLNGDFNEDGNVDLAIATSSDHAAIVVGSGNGDFEAERLISSVQLSPGSVVFGDFDGDGLIDALAIGNSNQIVLSPGDGNRGFLAPIGTPFAASSLVTSDFNGDGHPDLAIAPPNQPFEFDILLNDGQGNFSDTPFNTSFFVNSLAAGDFNGDHRSDLIVAANFNNTGELYLGDGQGGLTDAGPLTFDETPSSIEVADFNGDSKSDLLLIGQNIEVMLGNGDGTFQAPSFSVPFVNNFGNASITIADVNGDSKLDLVVANGSTSVTIYLGNGNGTFKTPIVVGLAFQAVGVAVADFNADGKPDIATADSGGPGISVLMGKGNMLFQSPIELAGVGNSIFSIDLTGGKHPDLISLSSNGLAVLRNSHVTVSSPPNTVACSDTTTHLTVHAAGRGTLSYQWRKDTIPLSDGGAISGSQESTLTLQSPTGTDSGSYDVVVVDECGTVTSDAATVIVQDPPPAPTIVAPLTVPPNASGLTASASFHAGSSYLWTPLLATIDSGQGTNQISFTSPGPGVTVQLEVIETSAGGCVSEQASTDVQTDFLDVPPSNEFHDYIDALALHGVTLGCGDGDYCPDQSLPRDQMGAFIARAAVGTPPQTGMIGGFSYDCTNGPSYFADVAVGSQFCAAIHYLAAQGITIGCDPTPDFCPGDLVTREQMALFIGRAVAPSATPPSAYSDGTTGRSYDCSVSSPFTDVPSGTPTCNAVGYIWAKGIVDGFGDGTYHPSDVLTRAPAAKFIANAFNLTLGP